jgi:hypothetical protein
MLSNDRRTQIGAEAAALLTLGELAAAAQPRPQETQKSDPENSPANSPDLKDKTIGERLARDRRVIRPPSSQDQKNGCAINAG